MLDKSNRNQEAGEWAENKNYYDVAISRYYYSLFQKIIFLMSENNKNNTINDDENSHARTINAFINKYYGQLSKDQNHRLSNLHRLRKNRNSADYSSECIKDRRDYDLTFKCYYNEANKVLMNIISKHGKQE